MIRVLSCLLLLAVAGCSVVAAPVRMTSAVVKVVPVVGDAAAAPLDASADIID